jgi:valyl-tRNA synthetase
MSSPLPNTPNTPTTGPELAKAYKPSEHEDRVWDLWIKANAFHADPSRTKPLGGDRDPYCILIPPPNVTAALHLGHGLNNTLQDILARSKRMQGCETLWMPGTDHAGIATQAVVEKRVQKEEKKRRTDFTREQFVAKIQAFKDEYEATITNQLKKMGCSCDWDRQRFTMDEQCAAAVREAFFQLFKDGLIYRGKRLVNWDPALQTAVADDECVDEEIDGAFYYLRYPLVHASAKDPAITTGSRENADAVPVTWGELARRGYPDAEKHDADKPAWITVATTRPETYLGDTGVAVNPHDPRAKALRGLFAELPLVGRIVPIVEDTYVVLPERYARNEEDKTDPKAAMATGFLKVTPAHDQNDWELGQRHTLAAINVMAPDASISDKHGWIDVGDAKLFVGKKREEARKLVVKEFEARGLFEGSKPHRHSVKHSDRSKAIVEPYLSDQWYVKVTDPRMAPAANAALHKKDLEFFPPRYAKTFEHWHDNIRDWCISRQLWWGHRIPVWTFDVSKPDESDLVSPEEYAQQAGYSQKQLSNATASLHAQLGAMQYEEHTKRLTGDRWTQYTLPHPTNAALLRVYRCLGNGTESLQVQLESQGWKQDPDVLDTWFSSALWPLSTLGWPDPAKFNAASNKGLLDAFNPTSTLCTAREIITLWVSRMVMFNQYFLGRVPYRDVYIHAVIQDGEGRKMSKSLGNGVDPLDIIATHGADAMRFTLCHMATNTQDVRMPVVKDSVTGKNTSAKFDLGRNFANKLWNASRFALSMLPADSAALAAAFQKLDVQPLDASLSMLDKWMLTKLAGAVREATTALEEYRFSDYATILYDLLWRDFCDWYLEGIKPSIAQSVAQQAVLATTLHAIVRLLHPVMPFVTETIFQQLAHVPTAFTQSLGMSPARKGGTLCTAGWPTLTSTDTLQWPASLAWMDELQGLVTAIRDTRAAQQVKPSRKIRLHHSSSALMDRFDGMLLMTLAGLGEISTTLPAPGEPAVALRFLDQPLHLSGLRDANEALEDAGAVQAGQRAQLERRIAELTKSVGTLEGRLNNPGYASKAPPKMVEETKAQLEKAREELVLAVREMESLGS